VAGDLPRTLLGELTAFPRSSSWIRGRGGRKGEEIGEDESGGGRRQGKERMREGRGDEDRRGQGKGGERKRNGKKRKRRGRGGAFPQFLIHNLSTVHWCV